MVGYTARHGSKSSFVKQVHGGDAGVVEGKVGRIQTWNIWIRDQSTARQTTALPNCKNNPLLLLLSHPLLPLKASCTALLLNTPMALFIQDTKHASATG